VLLLSSSYFDASIIIVLLIGSLALLSEARHLCQIDSLETKELETLIINHIISETAHWVDI
jgi:hypothetical protein